MTNFAAMSALTFGIQAFITLLVIIDPPGATPIFLSLVSKENKKRQRELAWQAATFSFGVVTLFAFFGKIILDYLHISVNALQVAIACKPATPAPRTTTWAGVTVPAAVINIGKNLGEISAATSEARYPAQSA